MVRTFDFIFLLKRSEKERNKICSIMEAAENADYDLGGWHLSFAQDRKIVTITDNGTDEYLTHKFCPAEISYDSLKELIDSDDRRDKEFYVKYL